MATETMKQVGDSLEWTSQAAGSWQTKKGTVVAIVSGTGRDGLFSIVKGLDEGKDAAASHIRGQEHSLSDRYLVRVDRPGKPPLWYAPMVKTIDNGLLANQPKAK